MGRTIAASVLILAVLAGPAARWSSAQVSLADDIILATQGKANAARSRQTTLGGTQPSPYSRSPGSTDIVFGPDPSRRFAPLSRLAQRPANPAEVVTPGPVRAELGHGLAPAVERLPPALLPTELPGLPAPSADDLDDKGPPTGLTLDEALERLVHFNPDLRAQGLEIPQAQADILTAGLRENPLLFYSSDSVPYGSYSRQRPGDIDHGLSLVLPIDYSGKRRARITLAERQKCILEARYGNAVRLAIDDLASVYVNACGGVAARSAERALGLLTQLLARARAKSRAGTRTRRRSTTWPQCLGARTRRTLLPFFPRFARGFAR